MSSKRKGTGIKISDISVDGTIKKNEAVIVKGGAKEDNIQKHKDEEGHEYIILKGSGGQSDQMVNLDNITNNLRALYQHSGKFISQLDSTASAHFRVVVDAVTVLKGTSAYDFIYEKIHEIFGRLTTAHPRTVGAYFIGCLVKTNFNGNPSCSAICAGSLQPSTGFTPCDHFAILYEGNRFTMLNDIENKSQTLIYISEGSKFSGFNQDEISTLSRLGVKSVKVVTYSSSGTSYTEAWADFIRLDSVNSGNGAIGSKAVNGTTSRAANGQSSSATNAVYIILFILLVLILLAVVWRSTRGARM